MGKQTIAEYIEDEATAAAVTRLGVDCGQGYHFGRPAPLADHLLRTSAAAAAND